MSDHAIGRVRGSQAHLRQIETPRSACRLDLPDSSSKWPRDVNNAPRGRWYDSAGVLVPGGAASGAEPELAEMFENWLPEPHGLGPRMLHAAVAYCLFAGLVVWLASRRSAFSCGARRAFVTGLIVTAGSLLGLASVACLMEQRRGYPIVAVMAFVSYWLSIWIIARRR